MSSATPAIITPRYQLLAPLGEGSMGAVYRAHDRLSGQAVALKRVTLEADDAGELRLALAHEFRTLAGLRHPHIISVLDYGFDHERQPFFTMELLHGAQPLLNAGRSLPRVQQIDLLIQALEALAYLHRRGVLHHDLKPENMLVAAGRLRLLDFGLAVLASQQRNSDAFGTFQYLAPEVVGGQPYSEQADLFSLGVVAYELLVGRHPIAAETARVFLRELRGVLPDLGSLADAPALAEVLGRLLAKTPAERPASAQAAIELLRAAAGLPEQAGDVAIRESYLQAAAFVGRAAELAQLMAALEQARAGQGSAFLIAGESGVGKSRLLDELRTQALVLGFSVLRGQAVEGGGLPYQLWREPLRALLATAPAVDDLTAGVLLPLVPDLPQLRGQPIAPAPELPGEAAQLRLLSMIAQLVLATDRPALLLLEDLHWASESLLPLPALLRQLGDRPVVVIGNYRSDERPDLPQQLSGMQLIELGRLNAEELAALSGAMLGEAGRQPAVQALLQQETEGNAFFLVEVVRALAEAAGDLDRIRSTTLPQQVLAGGVRGVVARRLAKVPAALQPLLRLLALAGRAIEPDLLAQLAVNDATAERWLAVCADAMVIELQDGRWQFQHAKLRDGALAEIAPAALPSMHRQVAEALEALHADVPEQAGRLAQHWELAGEPARAARAALLAGHHAAARFANTEALAYYTRALALTAEIDLAQRSTIIFARLQVHETLNDHDGKQADLDLLALIVAQLDLPELTIELRLAQARHLRSQSKYQLALEAADAVVQQAKDHALPLLVAKADGVRSTILEKLGEYTEAAYAATIALAVYEAEGASAQERCVILLALALLNLRQERSTPARGYIQQVIEVADAANLLLEKAEALATLSLIDARDKRFAESAEINQQGLALARQIGAKYFEIIYLNRFFTLALDQGDYETAETYFEQLQGLHHELNDHTRAANLSNMALLNLLVGRLAEARQQAEAAMAILRHTGQKGHIPTTLSILGHICGTMGDSAAAQAANAAALTLVQESSRLSEVTYILNNMGNLALDLENWPEALEHFQQALAIAEQINEADYAAEAHSGLATAYTRLGTHQQAAQHLEAAIEYILNNPFMGYWEPYRSMLQVAQVLQAQADERAYQVLACAYAAIQAQAKKLTKADYRWAFLNNLPANRDLVRLYEAWLSGPNART